MSNDSNTSIMTIAELIDTTFGDPQLNVIHHKHLQTILYLLASQLRLLERRVAVKIGPGLRRSSSSLSVKEINLTTPSKKKKRHPKSSVKVVPEKNISDRESSQSQRILVKTSTDKSLSVKTTSDKTFAKKSAADETCTIVKSTDNTIDVLKLEPKDENETSSEETLTVMEIDVTTKPTSTDKTSTNKTSTDKKSKSKSNTKQKPAKESIEKTNETTVIAPQDYQKLLDEVEELRERELRVIHQRADSREEHDKTPTPIASMDTVEATYEKLLVVERIPAEEAAARAGTSGTRRSGPVTSRLPVVTLELFDALARKVHQLELEYGPPAKPALPENAQLMQELRKGASLTEAMGALQLSARLEATEKTLQNVLNMVTELASPPPTNIMGAILEAPGGKEMSPNKSIVKQPLIQSSPKGIKEDSSTVEPPPEKPIQLSLPQVAGSKDGRSKADQVTYQGLETALQELRDQIMVVINGINKRSAGIADTALKLAKQLDGKLEHTLKLGSRVEDLENLVSTYVEQINILDTGLSSQMTNYQEELTQMQHDLDTGLETMAEVMANTGGDATAVAELNTRFSDLQYDIDHMTTKQKDLREVQSNLSLDLGTLRRQIEHLREMKSDRDEVIDALRDKVGLGSLNGLVTQEQFNAVRGDFEIRIKSSYDKFNNQEVVWQRAIDDLLKAQNEKADIIQVESLRDEISRHLSMFKAKLKCIIDILGEPTTAALSKKINRGTACLACATPAHMALEEPGIPKLPALRPPTIDDEARQPKEDGDHGLCFQGYPTRHSTDARSHVCNRWCGGSHTVLNNTVRRVPPCMIITPAKRNVVQEMGTDGKVYVVDDTEPKTPCVYCNMPPTSPESQKSQLKNTESYSDTIMYDFHPAFSTNLDRGTNSSLTPPLRYEDN